MRAELAKWVSDADAVRHLRYFSIPQLPVDVAYVGRRSEDYYLSLVGELFDAVRQDYEDSSQWARLGNALIQFSSESTAASLQEQGINRAEATLFAAAAFYFGGFPASACLTMRSADRPQGSDSEMACFDFLARPTRLTSEFVLRLLTALRNGNAQAMDAAAAQSTAAAQAALSDGPSEWITARLLERLLVRFHHSNVRAVLPDGASEFWNPLIASLLTRTPASWEFFPSQIEAIRGGLLEANESYALQMPTGAGKTTLCETLLYWHLKRRPNDAAVMLVPYRSLASELRATLVKRMNNLGLATRCAYGGTVPSGDEVHGLADTRAIVATPEALAGLLSADPAFMRRISLVICDEGHLLDGAGRGIGLELLLARFKAREAGAPRFVFVSAIVPNIEEINSWLGGSEQSVIRSTYRPALAEFAVLRPLGLGATASITLEMHPHEPQERRFSIQSFLGRNDFSYINPATGRNKTYGFSSVKTQAIAAARKALPMGAAAVFAANKRGNQGAVGLAEELLAQLDHDLSLPKPSAFVATDRVQKAVTYLQREYGQAWIGSRALQNGAVLHHGDIPQETREVVERLLRDGDVKLVICTSTLAEGVNLPIRALVLYSVQRRFGAGAVENLLSRDIKNLVGRAGRAGATTKGLVICANPGQWHLIEQVATQGPGEPVTGALHGLVDALRRFLVQQNAALTNELLERIAVLHPLVDGIDATLIDLIAEEIGEDDFVNIAIRVADQTLAHRQLEQPSGDLLRNVFALRARRIIGMRVAGRVGWFRETGAKVRLLDSVEQSLLPARARWDEPIDPIDQGFVNSVLTWAWSRRELTDDVREAYRLPPDADVATVRQSFFDLVGAWLSGASFVDMAARIDRPMDELLAIHTRALTFSLQTLVEQGISLLARLLLANGITLAPGAAEFPAHLRYGVPDIGAKLLASSGVRHRSASVLLGRSAHVVAAPRELGAVRAAALAALQAGELEWRGTLGDLIYGNTLIDLTVV